VAHRLRTCRIKSQEHRGVGLLSTKKSISLGPGYKNGGAESVGVGCEEGTPMWRGVLGKEHGESIAPFQKTLKIWVN